MKISLDHFEDERAATGAAGSSGHAPDAPREAHERRDLALWHCDEQIRFFRSAARRAHWLHASIQVITIVISASIPVILLVGEQGDPGWIATGTLVAVLSAIVAVTTGLAGAFHWHEQWIRYAFFAQRLISERAQFVTRAGIYGAALHDDAALDAFVTRSEDLRLEEAGQWRQRAIAATKSASRNGHENGRDLSEP